MTFGSVAHTIIGIMNGGCYLFAFVWPHRRASECLRTCLWLCQFQCRCHAENNRHLFWLCFINEITNVNRFIHRHSVVANEYKLSATTLCVSIRSEFIIKFSYHSVDGNNANNRPDCIKNRTHSHSNIPIGNVYTMKHRLSICGD